MNRKKSLVKKISSYSALAGAVVVGIDNSASSQIIYSDVQDVALVHNHAFLVDLNNDGTNDFGFQVSTHSIQGVTQKQVLVFDFNKNAIAGDYSYSFGY